MKTPVRGLECDCEAFYIAYRGEDRFHWRKMRKDAWGMYFHTEEFD